MDLSIKIEYLLKEEIQFELDTLHITYNATDSCDTLRKVLRQTRSLVRRGSLKPPTVVPVVDNAQLLATCQRRVLELKTAVHDDAVLSEGQRDRLVARANYYLNRIASITGSEAEVGILRSSLVTFLAQLNDEESSSESEDEVLAEPRMNSGPVPVCRAEPRHNLNSLNLRFKGDTCVRAFITRLEELRVAREIPEKVIFNGFPEILDGPALHWFRANKDTIHGYKELLKALRADFDIPDFDFKLMNEIRARTQARYESIVVFLSYMGGLFSRLTKPLAETDRLDILLRNIRPEYSRELALIDIESIQELKTVCMRLELAGARASNFSEPSTSGYTVAPDLQFSPRFGPRKQVVSSMNRGAEPDLFCFRCKVKDHNTSRCPRSRDLVCFRCGRANVRTPECPNCNPTSESKN